MPIVRQGQEQKNFFVLKTGKVQVHSTLMYSDYHISCIGPSQFQITQIERTVQVIDKKFISKRGELFAYSRLLNVNTGHKC